MKKPIALFLVFSLLALSASLYAKERRGAELVVKKKYGQWVRGELIAVKENSLLLLSISGADVSVDIGDINVIEIIRKPKTLLGAGLGFFVGGGVGALVGMEVSAAYFWGGDTKEGQIRGAAIGGVIGGLVGMAVGWYIGAHNNRFETILIEGKSDSEVKEALEKLRKKARVPDYQ